MTEQKSIHLQSASTVFLKEDWHHIIDNYILSSMMLRVSIFSVWRYGMMVIVQIIGAESSFLTWIGQIGKNAHSGMHVID